MSWTALDPWSYAYLLGLYLGDGWVGRVGRSTRLVLSLDARYPNIIDEAVMAAQLAAPRCRIKVRRHKEHACFIVYSYGPHWVDAFPQAGPGRKHERPIVLADWQRAIVDRHTEQFLRGLIHSDGCRTVNRFKTKLPSGRVAEYRHSVAILDGFIGPKQ